MDRPSRWFWLVCFLGTTAWAMLYLQYFVFQDLADGRAGTLPRRLADELVGAYAAFAFLPAIAAVARRFPLRRGRLARSLAAHVGALAVYSVLHTVVIAVAHEALYPLLGLLPDRFEAAPGARALQQLGHDVLGYAAFLAYYAAWDARRARQERELGTARLERALVDAQLRTLRLQLQPHFLFNTLNTISEAVYDDPRVADAMIQNLAELLRHTLRATPDHEVTLAEELDTLARYTAIMTARFGDRLRVRVDVAAGAEQACVPPLLLQPLVENVIRHGMTTGRLEIDVCARITGTTLVLEVADNGPGATGADERARPGIGLSSSAERLRLLYGPRAELVAGNRDTGGFCVRMRLPVREAA